MRLLIAGAWRKDCKTHNVGTKKITRNWFLFKGRICALIALAVCIIGIPTLLGQTWDGGGNSGNWATGANWNPNVVPGSGANIIFNAAGANSQWTITFGNNSRTVGSLTFANAGGTNGFIFNTGTGTLTINGAGIANNDTIIQSFNVPITVSSAQTWNAGSGGLMFTGAVSLGGNLTFSGSANTNVTGTLTLTGTRTITNNAVAP